MRKWSPTVASPFLYCLAVFGFSVIPWLLEELAAGGVPGIPVNLPLSSLMAFLPLAAACLFVYGKHGGEGIRHLFARLLDVGSIRRKKIWLLPALFLMPAVMAVSWLAMALMKVPLPAPDLHWPMVPVFFVVFVIAAAGEEAGWMLFVVDPLQERWNALVAGIVCGAVWAVWHLVPYVQAGHDAAWIAGHCLVTVCLRIAIVWLYNNAGRNVPMAVLLHASANVGFFLFPDYGSHYDPMVTAVVLGFVVAVLVCVWGYRTLADFGAWRQTRPGNMDRKA